MSCMRVFSGHSKSSRYFVSGGCAKKYKTESSSACWLKPGDACIAALIAPSDTNTPILNASNCSIAFLKSVGVPFESMVNPFRKSFVTGISELTRFGLTAQPHPDPEDGRIPIGPGDVASAGGARPVFARLPVEDIQLDSEKGLVVRRCRARFGVCFLEEPFGDIIRKIKSGFFAVVHAVSIVLVNRNRPSVAQPPRPIIDQSQVNAVDVIVAGIVKGVHRQVGRFIAKGHVYVDLIVHGGIVLKIFCYGHSYFPGVVFVRDTTVTSQEA